jgi:hypothetical protein
MRAGRAIALIFVGGAIHGLGAQGIIQLRVIDQAAVPTAVMRTSRTMVDEILRRATLKTSWIDCPLLDLGTEARARCSQPMTGADFWMHVVTRKLPGEHRHALGDALYEAFGEASIYIYYPDVRVFAVEEACDPALVLAAVITHEIGHVLLRSPAHSRRGIMAQQLTWEQMKLAEKGALLFSASEARRISRRVLEWPSGQGDDR